MSCYRFVHIMSDLIRSLSNFEICPTVDKTNDKFAKYSKFFSKLH